MKDADHACRLVAQYREKVEAFDHAELKLAYFQGALDWAAMMDAEGNA